MTLSLRRAPILVGALCLTLGAASASASRGLPRTRSGKQAAAAVTRGAPGKPMRTRQLRSLRPAKKITRARKPAARRPVRRVSRLRPLSLVQGLIGAFTSPAERLIADIAVSLVKYELNLREHNPFTGEVQRLALSQVDEVALGALIAQHVVPATGTPLSGRPMENYLDGIVQRLVRANGIDRITPYRFKVHLVHSDTPNAFAAPGGRIVVTTALLAQMKSEASIAAILAHEIGHVVARHGSQNLARSQLVDDLVGKLRRAAGNDIAARIAVLQSSEQLELEMLSFSRDQEHQSDALGVRFVAGAGYSARGVEEMADFLMSMDGSLAFDDSGSDHPSPVARRSNLYAAARERGMTYTGEHGAERFALNVTLPLALGIF